MRKSKQNNDEMLLKAVLLLVNKMNVLNSEVKDIKNILLPLSQQTSVEDKK